jgi:TPR repeat protein
VGAHGVAKDIVQAEKYLKIGAEGGDVVSQRHYGHFLVEGGRGVEAAEMFRLAVAQGITLYIQQGSHERILIRILTLAC